MTDRFSELAQHLWRGGQYAYWWTPDGDERTNPDGSTWREKVSLWFPADQPAKIPQTWLENCNVYFGVHPLRARGSQHSRGKIDDVAAVNCFFAEFDVPKHFENKRTALDHIRRLPAQPSALVASGGGFHCYWSLSETVLVTDENRAHLRALQGAWVELVGGDDGAKDLARVLRVPGTLNRKAEHGPVFPAVQIVKFDQSITVTLEDVERLTAPILAAQVQASAPRQPAQNAGNIGDREIWEMAFSGPFGYEVHGLYRGDLDGHGGDRSAADYALCRHLAHYTGGDAWAIDRLFRQSGLMRDKWEQRADYRDRTIQQAIQNVGGFFDWQAWQAAQVAQAAAQGAVGGYANAYANGHGPTVAGAPSASPAPAPMPLDTSQLLLNESADDRGNAVCAFVLHGKELAYCASLGYLYYNGTHWEAEGAESELKRIVTNVLMQRRTLAVQHNQEALIRAAKPSASNVRNCIYMLQALIDVSVSEFDADPDLLNCKNGVVNLQTGEIAPHDPAQRFTYCVPVDYDPSADYVEWVEFLAGVDVGDLADFLQLAVGYSLTGHTREECLFYIHGPTRSGKGTFTETLLSILPRPLGVEANFSTFTASREGDTQNFDLAPLKPCRVVIASESNKYDRLNEGKIKMATGGNEIMCAFKHRDHFNYRPQFKIWLVSNHPVSGDENDDAFWGRVRVVTFPTSFLGKEDKRLKQRMKSPEVLRGVLAWAVAGAIQWYELAQGLPLPARIQEDTNRHRLETDYVQQWLDECCEANLDDSGWTSNAVLHKSYREWCEEYGVQAKQAVQFGRALSAKGYDAGERRYLPNGKRVRGTRGITII